MQKNKENQVENNESEIIITTEKYIYGIINFIIVFPKTLILALWKPRQTLTENTIIKPLTFYTITLLITSRFWYYWWLPHKGLISPIVDYLRDPKLSKITTLLFDSNELFKTILSLLPIIAASLLLINIITRLFKLQKSEVIKIKSILFYTSGVSLLFYPILFALYAYSFLEYYYEAIILNNIINYTFIVLFLAIQIRFIWIAINEIKFNQPLSFHLIKRFGLFLVVILFCFASLRSPSLFYKDTLNVKSQIVGNIDLILQDSIPDKCSINTHILLTNYSSQPEIVDIKHFKCILNTKSNNFTAWVKASDIISSSKPISEIMIIDGYSTFWYNTSIEFKSKNIYDSIKKALEDQYINEESFNDGSFNLSLSFRTNCNIQSSEKTTIDYSRIN